MSSVLVDHWRNCGIEPNDVVLIHSSLRRTLREHRTKPQDVLQSFLSAVGPKGTVLFPLFNFDFPKGVRFDIRSTASQMGALTEAARQFPGAVRSGHPIYSFAIIGADAEKFSVDNSSGYGPDSPFAVLRQLVGKIGVLGLEDQDSMTFYHHIEEMNEVSYRYHKKFTGQYTDAAGKTTERTYSLFVRDLDKGVKTDVNPMSKILWEKGLYKGSKPTEGPGLRTICANSMYEAVSEVIQSDRAKGLLYKIE